jgi:hypothetical protein
MRLTILLLLLSVSASSQINIGGTSSVTGTVSLGGIGTAVVLTSVVISPSVANVSYVGSQSFTALGTYTDSSLQDVTATATWTSSNTGIANNLGIAANPGSSKFQCISRGTVTITATLNGVSGIATLTCQSPTFSPQGTINVNQSGSAVTVVQFTGANGSSPFTFSSVDLPGWLALSNIGCPGNQVNCSLVGAPTVVAVSSFHIQATDNIGNKACPGTGCAVSVNVVATSAEDNAYCNSSEVVIGLSMDGPANPLQNCNYTAIAGSSLGGSPTVIYVCPIAQQSGGSSVTGCANAPQPVGGTKINPACYTVGGIFCSTISSAVDYVATTSGCGSDVRIYATIDDTPSGAQNQYWEPTVIPISNINCGPDFSQPWWYIRTKQFANLPPAGNRITPSWVNQTSIPGRPTYPQTTDFSIAAGTYMPLWGCEVIPGPNCHAFSSAMNSSTVGGIFSGLRVMGIMFVAASGRDTTIDLWGNNICPLNSNNTPQCSPGSSASIVVVGCLILLQNNCNTPSNLNLDDFGLGTPGWQAACVGPACAGGVGTPSSYSQTFVNTSPSLDGNSMMMTETGTNYSNVMFHDAFGANNSATTFTGTYHVQIPSVTPYQVWGMDMYQYIPGVRLMWGSQCALAGSTAGFWSFFDQGSGPNGTWHVSTIACPITSATWYTISMTVHRVPGDTSCAGGVPAEYYDSITQNGVTTPISLTYCSETTTYSNDTGMQFDISSNVTGGTLTAYVDEMSYTATSTIGSTTGSPHGTGSQHVIFDRVLWSACKDISQATCFDSVGDAIITSGGQHISIIDSYIVGFHCNVGIGPCVESHGTSGGNPQESLDDIGTKIVNNFIEASSENTFMGGGTSASGIFPTDLEQRRNHMFKTLMWKMDDPSYPGKVQDLVVINGKVGAGYSGTTTCSIDAPLSGTQATCTAIVSGGGIVDAIVTNKGSGYGLITKSNGNIGPASPQVYFTDGGTTYASCVNQLTGNVNTSGTSVTWSKGRKFIPGLVGTAITIVATNYTVASFINNTTLTLTTAAPTLTNAAYTSNLPSRGDCVLPEIGYFNIKNLGELKQIKRALYEGNVEENVWIGQSDQSAYAMLMTPKSANGLCPTCTIQDVVVRYSLYRNMDRGFELAQAAAAQGGTLAQGLARISIHDVIMDGINGIKWAAGSGTVSQSSGECVQTLNVQAPPFEVNAIRINHVTCIATTPTGASLTGGSAWSLDTNYGTSNTLLPNMVFQNSIAAGGVKNFSLHSPGGLANCSNNACTDQSGRGPTESALRLIFPNSNASPVSAGNYTKNQVQAMPITEGGNCTVLPTTATFSGGGGTGATAAFNTGAGTNHNAIIKLWIVFPGSGYTSAPTLSFNGTCSVPPTAAPAIAGAGIAGNSSVCFDHMVMPTAAWGGILAGTPYPTAQIDPVNNACDSTTGGHINTNTSGTPITVSTWADVQFTNFPLASDGSEIATGDLHLKTSSPFHNGANDGTDIGANVNLVLGASNGSAPSIYTGCTISAGMAVCPP